MLYLFGTCVLSLSAQNGVAKVIDISVEGKSLNRVLYDISEGHGVTFYFRPDELPYYFLEGSYKSEPIFQILQSLLNGTDLKLLPYKDQGIVVVKSNAVNADNIEAIIASWENGTYSYQLKEQPTLLNLNFGFPTDNTQQQKLVLHIQDQETNEILIGATISNADFTIAESTNENGKANLQLPAGEHVLKLSYTGYQDINLDLSIYKNAEATVEMQVKSYFLDEINIVANSSESRVSRTESGMEVINLEKLDNVPQLLGELDIIKSLELLPGVTSSTELSQGFNVRGGGTDQNLIMLNDGIIFNPTHIVGFISALNADVISDATLYKGYIDPSFGSRLSGVLDMHASAKGAEEFEFKGGLGTSLIKISGKGPVLDKKADVLFGIRGSFNDYLLKRIANVDIQRSNARFYDMNFVFGYNFSESTRVQWSSYLSDDFFEYNDAFGFNWANGNHGLKVDTQFGAGIYSHLSVSMGSYVSDNFILDSPAAFSFTTGLKYRKALLSFNKKLSVFGLIKWGLEFVRYSNNKDRLLPTSESTLQPMEIQRKGSQSISPFLSFNKELSDKLSMKLGLRLSNYTATGLGKIYEYTSSLPSIQTITESNELVGLDKASATSILEPRITVSLKPTDLLSLKAAYSRSSQNIFQASTTNSALPSDIYIMSDRYVRPAVVDQYSLGFASNIKDKIYGLSVDVFYKTYKDLYELKDFAVLILNDHIETELLESEGYSFGCEFLIDKNKGKWKGSMAYTYSRTFRRSTDNREAINRGEWFAANFDIPHQLNILSSYQWLPMVAFNASYVYRTGKPFTPASGTISQDEILVPLYSDRNTERIPYYSRLDLSIQLDLRKSKKEGFRNAFSLGFYNFFGRRNPSNVFFRRSAKGNVIPFQFAVVGAVIPNLSWNFTF